MKARMMLGWMGVAVLVLAGGAGAQTWYSTASGVQIDGKSAAVTATNTELNADTATFLRAYDTVIWDTPPGNGYDAVHNVNVMAFDPGCMDAPGGDYRNFVLQYVRS